LRAITIVLKNFSRRKGRLFSSSVGLILAIAVIISTFVITNALQDQIGEEIEKYGANIVVTPKSQSINVPYGSVVTGAVTLPEAAVGKIFTIPNGTRLRVVSPKLYGQLQAGDSSLLIVGAIPEREAAMKGWWEVTGALPQNDTAQALVGSAVEAFLRSPVGSKFTLQDTTFTVTGILKETGGVDDYSIFLPLRTAQNLLNQPNAVSVIDVSARCKYCPVEDMAEEIMQAIPEARATPVKQNVQVRMKTVEQTANFSLILASVILIVGCAGVMNTMLASINERRKEIGILMALGASGAHLNKIFILESLILGIIGGIVGVIVGLVSSLFIGPTIMKIPVNPVEVFSAPIDGAPYAKFLWKLSLEFGTTRYQIETLINLAPYVRFLPIPLSVILSVIACLVASIYPAKRASKIDPVEALRTL